LVLPLVDEHKPKCFVCHDLFQNLEELTKHQELVHKDFFEKYENKQ